MCLYDEFHLVTGRNTLNDPWVSLSDHIEQSGTSVGEYPTKSQHLIIHQQSKTLTVRGGKGEGILTLGPLQVRQRWWKLQRPTRVSK